MNTENNILIAEFMGLNKISSNVLKKALLSDLDYHLSFDSLMPAVEKIESTKTFNVAFGQFYDDETQKLTGEYYCKIINYSNDIVDITGCSTRIEAVYKGVIEFIKWINSINLEINSAHKN